MKVIQRPPPCPTASSLLTFSVFPQFRALAPMYYRGSAAAIIVYDITKEVFTFSPNPTKCGSYPLNFHGRYEFVCRIACPYPHHQESFQTLKNWVKELRQHGPPNIVVAIAGNKCDLSDARWTWVRDKTACVNNADVNNGILDVWCRWIEKVLVR